MQEKKPHNFIHHGHCTVERDCRTRGKRTGKKRQTGKSKKRILFIGFFLLVHNTFFLWHIMCSISCCYDKCMHNLPASGQRQYWWKESSSESTERMNFMGFFAWDSLRVSKKGTCNNKPQFENIVLDTHKMLKLAEIIEKRVILKKQKKNTWNCPFHLRILFSATQSPNESCEQSTHQIYTTNAKKHPKPKTTKNALCCCESRVLFSIFGFFALRLISSALLW